MGTLSATTGALFVPAVAERDRPFGTLAATRAESVSFLSVLQATARSRSSVSSKSAMGTDQSRLRSVMVPALRAFSPTRRALKPPRHGIRTRAQSQQCLWSGATVRKATVSNRSWWLMSSSILAAGEPAGLKTGTSQTHNTQSRPNL